MKIGIVSDTHMMIKNMEKTIPYLKECDLIIHAGDNFTDSRYIHSMTNVGIIAVKGNCDFDAVEEEVVFEVANKTIFLCHGDKYGVKYGTNMLEKKATEVDADIVIFGHTHTPFREIKDGVLYIKPGSTSLPRGVSYKSFVIMNIEEDDIKIEEIRI
ncbi:metallophosphoesterase [Clostridioides difficile]|nr:metallophosphoesterase [Clostridioides difficile]